MKGIELGLGVFEIAVRGDASRPPLLSLSHHLAMALLLAAVRRILFSHNT